MEPFWATGHQSAQDMDQTPLFGQYELDLGFDPTATDQTYFDDMASAPTPYMAPIDTTQDDLFGDIDTDDLMSPNEVEIATHCLEITGEAEVLNNAPPTTSDQLADNARASTRANKRKYEPVYEDDSDGESVATYTSKSKAGRKPKGSQKCMSRNAIAARENREKKKAYIEAMEKRLKTSTDEAKSLRVQLNELQKNYDKLVKENEYHKGVLANQSSIGALIKQLTAHQKIELIGTSFVESKPSVTNTAADPKQRKSHRIASNKGDTSPPIGAHTSGICLHIHNKKVSLELCAKCSQKQNRKAK